jgi:hypothetical protein
MANLRYFADINGESFLLSHVQHNGSAFKIKAHHFSGKLPTGERVTASRVIERKPNPTNHKCDARCEFAKGFKCECACGGKNHGRGSAITCLAA